MNERKKADTNHRHFSPGLRCVFNWEINRYHEFGRQGRLASRISAPFFDERWPPRGFCIRGAARLRFISRC